VAEAYLKVGFEEHMVALLLLLSVLVPASHCFRFNLATFCSLVYLPATEPWISQRIRLELSSDMQIHLCTRPSLLECRGCQSEKGTISSQHHSSSPNSVGSQA
jgi:hypothetical protein